MSEHRQDSAISEDAVGIVDVVAEAVSARFSKERQCTPYFI
jgi:hypothetical protein